MSTQLNMADGIRQSARSYPAQEAAVDGERRLTFGAIDERSNRLASGLLARGHRPGEPVAVLSGNRIEYLEIATALAKAGLPMVSLNAKSTAADNAYVVSHSGARALILDNALADAASSVVDDVDITLSMDGDAGEGYEDFLTGSLARDPQVGVDEDGIFAIAYTSGTTGVPKGVQLTHRGRVLTAYGAALKYGLGPSRSTMAVAPLYHGAGFSFGYIGPQFGGKVTILRSWDPEEFLRLLSQSRTNSVFLVPTHAQQVRRVTDEPMRDYDLSALETLYFNAAALPVELKEWVHRAFPGVDIHELYGSTECSIVTDLRPEDSLRKAGTVGHPWFMNDVRLLDDDGQEVPPGTPGELFARSPMLMAGYLHDEEATREATTEDGFVTVGDVAVRDDDGYISIVDRKKDMVVSGGVNIFPREIEEMVVRHRDVDEVAVVGLPDETYGERVAAFVVSAPGREVDVAALGEFARDGLARYKAPREWHVVDALPRNASGKIVKQQLRDGYVAGGSNGAPTRRPVGGGSDGQ